MQASAPVEAVAGAAEHCKVRNPAFLAYTPKQTIEQFSLVQTILQTLHILLDQVGDRCQVEPGQRRGQVAFVGEVIGLPSGLWIGVIYDEPVGKHDGM